MHTAIVGIGPGLGMAISRRFAQGGHRVSLVARSIGSAEKAAGELRSAGLSAAGYEGDAADSESMQRVFDAMRARDGDIDNLVFNVALVTPDRLVTSSVKSELGYGERWKTRGSAVTPDEFIDTLRINVGGALICAKQVADAMCSRRSGAIIVTGGTLALAPWVEWGSLSAGKAALRSLTRSLFKELRPFDVHAALVTIHDTIVPGTPYDPDIIARYYWDIAAENPADWVAEYDFNPTGAEAVDRDL
ncbi:SDR family NAD(P)-dependent oxidoreductase [Rhizorhabdus dicambivorans]|nr:SDR family NAD(P)-dependent oxidoreductase [Rhizorhabdus dicambivorans]